MMNTTTTFENTIHPGRIASISGDCEGNRRNRQLHVHADRGKVFLYSTIDDAGQRLVVALDAANLDGLLSALTQARRAIDK